MMSRRGPVSASVCEEPLEENWINLPSCCGLRRVKGRRVLGSRFDGCIGEQGP